MATYTATYSPDDNKLRLTASARLDADTYARVKAAGFAWAPKLEQFIAPMWTPSRADLCIELAGQIDDDDGSLIERAEDRAERFEDYRDKRADEAERAADHVRQIADGIPFGQPILVGHHSERHARKDAERIEIGMRKAVQLFDTSEYWKGRAAAAIAHAKYKERPDVRHRRIKGIEADQRKLQKSLDETERALARWEKLPSLVGTIGADGTPATLYDLALYVSGREPGYSSRRYPLADFPRDPPASQHEGEMSLYSALSGHVITGEHAHAQALRMYQPSAHAARWMEHYANRLAYERAMLAEGGGIKADGYDLQPGGTITHRGRRSVILRVNRRDGIALSISVTGQSWTVGVEEITSYEPPSEAAAGAVETLMKKAPICNYPGRGFVSVTQAQWSDVAADCKGTRDMGAGVDATNGGTRFDTMKDYRAGSEVYTRHRVRVACGLWLRRTIGPEAWAAVVAASSATQCKETNAVHSYIPVFITDAKTTEPVRLDAPPKAPRKTMARKIAEASGVDTDAQAEPVQGVQGVQADPAPAETPAASEMAPDRLFVGIYPVGISYADRQREKGGDYVRLAFLGFADLALSIEPDCPDALRLEITEHAATIQRRRGEAYQISTAGQTVTLGHALRDDPPPAACPLTAAKREARAVIAELTAPRRPDPVPTQPAHTLDPFKLAQVAEFMAKGYSADYQAMGAAITRAEAPATHTAPPAGDSRASKIEAMRASLRAGVQVVSAPQLFPTPPTLAARMVDLADITPASRVLEPSAGTGRIVDAIMRQVPACVHAVEINRDLAGQLQARHAAANVHAEDFLEYQPADMVPFDCIVMNPPFANGADVAHVTHAVQFLAPGGRLVAIMSAGVKFRDDRKTRDFRALVDRMRGTVEDLPDDTFASAGTGVRAVLVVLDAPEREQRAA